MTSESTLSFKKTCKNTLYNFKQIRSLLPENAAKMFLHSMIFSHIEYCITNRLMTNQAALKPIELSYKRALKILDKKPCSYHCLILHKYKYLSFDNLKFFKLTCSIYIKVYMVFLYHLWLSLLNSDLGHVTEWPEPLLEATVPFLWDAQLSVNKCCQSKAQRYGTASQLRPETVWQ